MSSSHQLAIIMSISRRTVAPLLSHAVSGLTPTISLFLACLISPSQHVSSATEPALEGAIVSEGQIFWLAADSINEARQQQGLPELKPGDTVDLWPDQSGHARHFRQDVSSAQPTITQVGDHQTVRFDGQEDHLRCLVSRTSIDKGTLFLVVAPHENLGDFRGLLSAGTLEGRDYQTGFNVDLGPGPTLQFDQLNVEGPGFGGARDLLDRSLAFGELAILHCIIDPASRQITTFAGNAVVGKRPFEPTTMSLEHLTLGARFYTNGPGAQQVRGPIKADFAEIVMYDQVLSSDEQTKIFEHFKAKYAKLKEELPRSLKLRTLGKPLVKFENPPPIQMLIPGFEVTEIPVELTNVNNVRFRDDGILVTLGYNGDIHLLSDTDGDGIEDKANIFWKNEGQLRGPIGLQWTPHGDPRGRGAFIPSKGKVSFIIDHDGDDRGDEERVIASGWEEIPQNVDAVGIAMDRDGALYFGLGTANYANAFLLDDQGNASYDLKSERGTIQRISPDLTSRSTICTGVRFPVALAFTSDNQLYCTDQEGATWLPNGNPFDELLHIRQGLHYGFPPRHPLHNPNVIDEPSTFDFGPQHQSTCGLVFNGSAGETKLFGPKWWGGDAIVCGESRGKLWRVSLGETPHGFVATSQLFACLQMLTVDACVAPNGDLVVACHSGPPDWGTGPAGIGKLFRIRSNHREVARPVSVWAASANEVRVSFDHPLSADTLPLLQRNLKLEAGQYVRAGDRFENLTPPYAVVQRQLVAPRFSLPIHSVSVTPDLRTLIITTDPMKHREFSYCLMFADLKAKSPNVGTTNLENAFEVDFMLRGTVASWHPQYTSMLSTNEPESDIKAPLDSNSSTIWLPHIDLQIAKAWTAESEEHRKWWEAIDQQGTLILLSKIDCTHLLQPRVQPGSTLDYSPQIEKPTLILSSSVPFSGILDETPFTGQRESTNPEAAVAGSIFKATISIPDPGKLIDFQVSLQCDADIQPTFHMGFYTAEDNRLRPLGQNRFVLPWVPSEPPAGTNPPRETLASELDGENWGRGNWGRGRRLFMSESVGCAKCHQKEEAGGKIGPSLANLIHRDFASVLRDIRQPSFAINPDYINHTILLNDGRILKGVIRSDNDFLIIGDSEGQEIRLQQTDVETVTPLAISAMPNGLVDALNPDELKDLMTYLLSSPPQMPLDSPLTAPPIRSLDEVQKALSNSIPLPEKLKPLQIVLVAGPKDHGPGEHDYPTWQVQWAQLLSAATNVNVTLAWEFPSDEQLNAADTLIFFQKGDYDDTRSRKLDAYQARGGGMVLIHWAVNGNARASEFAKHIGLASRGGSIRYRHGPLKLDLHNTTHPILRNLASLELYDESYWLLSGTPEKINLLASSVEDNEARPQVWTYEKGPSRVFVSIPGHYSWTFDDALFRVLLLRGIAWSANESVDRFNELVPLGARLRR